MPTRIDTPRRTAAPQRYAAEPEVLAYTTLSHGALRVRMQDPSHPFPQPIAVSPRRKVWDMREVEAWLDGQRQRRDIATLRAADIAARRPTFTRSA